MQERHALTRYILGSLSEAENSYTNGHQPWEGHRFRPMTIMNVGLQGKTQRTAG